MEELIQQVAGLLSDAREFTPELVARMQPIMEALAAFKRTVGITLLVIGAALVPAVVLTSRYCFRKYRVDAPRQGRVSCEGNTDPDVSLASVPGRLARTGVCRGFGLLGTRAGSNPALHRTEDDMEIDRRKYTVGYYDGEWHTDIDQKGIYDVRTDAAFQEVVAALRECQKLGKSIESDSLEPDKVYILAGRIKQVTHAILSHYPAEEGE